MENRSGFRGADGYRENLAGFWKPVGVVPKKSSGFLRKFWIDPCCCCNIQNVATTDRAEALRSFGFLCLCFGSEIFDNPVDSWKRNRSPPVIAFRLGFGSFFSCVFKGSYETGSRR